GWRLNKSPIPFHPALARSVVLLELSFQLCLARQAAASIRAADWPFCGTRNSTGVFPEETLPICLWADPAAGYPSNEFLQGESEAAYQGDFQGDCNSKI